MAAPTFSNPGKTVIKPAYFAHIFLRTEASKLQTMIKYYETFLSARIQFQNDMMAFLAYDEEHHRVAIAALPGTVPKDPNAAGLFHFAFTFHSLADLALAYRQRLANGIEPYWCVNRRYWGISPFLVSICFMILSRDAALSRTLLLVEQCLTSPLPRWPDDQHLLP